MLNIKIIFLVLIIIAALLLGMGLGYGYRKGDCILCKKLKKSESIISKSEKKGELDQDDANVLVSDMVKLGIVKDDGTFELSEGKEEDYKVISDTLSKYGYTINYKSIIAEKS